MSIISSNPKKCHLRLNFFMYNGEGEEDTKVGSFYTPLFSQGEFTSDEFNWEDEWMIEFDQPLDAILSYSGEIIYEDGSKVEIDTEWIDIETILINSTDLLIQLDENINVSFLVDECYPTLIVESSLTGELPSIMMIVEDVYADDRKFMDEHEFFSYGFLLIYDKNDIFQVVHIQIPPQYRYNKMFLMHINNPTFTEDPLYIQSPEMISVCDLYGYFILNGQESIDVLISRDPNTFEYYLMRVCFCEFEPENLFLTFNGATVVMKPNIATLMLLPRYHRYHAMIMNETSGEYIYENSFLNWGQYADHNIVRAYYAATDEQKAVSFQCAITSIGEQEPYFTIDLSIYQSFYQLTGYYFFSVSSNNTKLVKCEFNDQVIIQTPEQNVFFRFELFKKNPNDTDIAKFSAICPDDPYGVACEITYKAPNVTGFHLIRYPNRDGISITGRGFLSELIPVEKGKEFVYYKTYNDSIEIIREYTTEEIENEKIKFKVMDSRNIKNSRKIQSLNNTNNANLDLFIRARTICLYDSKNQIVPFSRKFAEENMDRFIELLGISSDIDYNYFVNDENGCIIFDPKYIESNDFHIPLQVCDFYSNNSSSNNNNNTDQLISTIDTSDMFFQPGGVDPNQRKVLIIFIIIVLGVLIIIILLIILCCYYRKKRKEERKKKKQSRDKLSRIELAVIMKKEKLERKIQKESKKTSKKLKLLGKQKRVENIGNYKIDKNSLSISNDDDEMDKKDNGFSNDAEANKNDSSSLEDEEIDNDKLNSSENELINHRDDNREDNEQCIPNDDDIVNNQQCIPNDDEIDKNEPRLDGENAL